MLSDSLHKIYLLTLFICELYLCLQTKSSARTFTQTHVVLGGRRMKTVPFKCGKQGYQLSESKSNCETITK